jgi:hypothetical protein
MRYTSKDEAPVFDDEYLPLGLVHHLALPMGTLQTLDQKQRTF